MGEKRKLLPHILRYIKVLKVIDREYEKAADAEETNCRLFLKSSIHEAKMAGKSLFDIVTKAEDDDSDNFGDEIEMMTEAVLERKDGRISVTYKERTEGFENVKTSVSFMENDRNIITVSRGGGGEGFVIEKGKRNFSLYRTPYGIIEMCVYGKNVENNLTLDGGEIIMDYSVELKGMTAQRTRMKLKVIV